MTVNPGILCVLGLKVYALTMAPFVFALNEAVLGYFLGIYIDRAVKRSSISFIPTIWQGMLQLVVMFIAVSTYPPPYLEGSKYFILAAAFTAAQSALSGFLIGVLFQYFYLRGYGRVEPGAVPTISPTRTAHAAD